MRLPFSPYAGKELVTFAGGFLLLSLAAWLYVHPAAAAVPLVLFVFVVAFFRDPDREVPPDREDLVSPADGTVTDIVEVDDTEFLGGKAQRIGIFLSVFDVHLNRAPCAGSVEKIHYRKGRFHDARNPLAGSDNEALTLGLYCADHDLRVVVRQIAGAIARRIVCRLEPGAAVGRGERYGMIKFGSRTELLIPSDRVAEIAVKEGGKVRAGSTILARIRPTKGGS
jgi:phosphatidylserine decarboxylase